MLGLALRGASAISKAGKGAQMAQAITGRKKKPEPGTARPGGGEGGGGGSAIIKAKVVSAPASAIVPVKKSPNVQQGTGSGIISILETIRANVKEIDDFYKGTVAAKREEIKKRKKQESDQRKAEQETKLEKPKIDKKPKGMKGLKMPKTGILDGIFRFISNVLMGMLVMKLIDFADTLEKSGILPLLGKIGDFILDIGGKILNGLITFIDKGYEIYDGLRKSIGDNFGEGAQEQFDSLAGTLNKVLNTVFSVGLAISLLAGAIPQKPKPRAKPKPGQGIDAKSGRPRKPKPNEIIDPDGKIRAKTKPETKLKSMGLDDDQIQAFNKARAGGANTPQAMAQARKVKPKPKPKGFFGRLGEGFQKAGEGLAKAGQSAVDIGVSGLKAIGGGLNKISGGNLGKLGNFLGEQYNNVSKFARNKFDQAVALGGKLKSKFGSAMESVKSLAGNMKKGAQNFIVKKIIEPLRPFLDPVVEKAKSIGKALMDKLKKIPGFDNVLQVLKKKGIGGLGDAAGLLKKVGAKTIPIVGGIFNLLFAYDRLAGGDTFGALLELMSAGFDISGLFGFAPGPGISMGIDAYMFARDFVPILQEGEENVINKIGLGSLKSNLDSMASKLPDLGSIVAKFQGKDVEQKSASQIATTASDGSTPAPAASDTPAPAASVNIDTVAGGSREQSEGTKISGDLGRFLYKELNSPRDFQAVTEHPDFGGSFRRSYNSYHNYDRAIDIGVYPHEQPKILKAIKKFNEINGVSPVELLHAGNDPDGDHDDHVHIAYEGGGYVGGKYNMKSLERRASYEGGEQMIDIPIPTPQQPTITSEPELIPSGTASFSAEFKDDFEFLEFQG